MYQWLKPSFNSYIDMKNSGRMPQGILICAQDGMGIHDLAMAISRDFLCTSESHDTDCNCHSCTMFNASTHPDFCVINRESEGNSSLSIGIDSLRKAITSCEQTATNGHGKVLLLEDAHLMTTAASNALLKTLEEPPLGILIILTTNNMQSILPTIISRTIRMQINLPSYDVLNKFVCNELNKVDDYRLELAITGMSPLKTVELVKTDMGNKIKESLSIFSRVILKEETPNSFVNYLEKNIPNGPVRFSLLFHIIKDIMLYQCGTSLENLNILYNYESAVEKLKIIHPNSLSTALSKLMTLKKIESFGIKITPISAIQLRVWLDLLVVNI
ncbi:MAG: AAA family ATPase [Succinivibrionaceae bacterium]